MRNHTQLTRSLLKTSAVLATLTFSLLAAAKLSKTGGATAGFHASGPAGLGIDGTTSDVSVGDDGTTVTVTVALGNLTTGIAVRDKHMKESLDVAAHPNTELKVARSALKFPADGAESSGDAKGTMKLHGQTKDVTFHYTAKNSGGTYTVDGKTRININDFGMKTPSYLGVSVKPDVDVSTKFQAKDN